MEPPGQPNRQILKAPGYRTSRPCIPSQQALPAPSKSGSQGGMGGFASPAGNFFFCIARLAFGCGGHPVEPPLSGLQIRRCAPQIKNGAVEKLHNPVVFIRLPNLGGKLTQKAQIIQLLVAMYKYRGRQTRIVFGEPLPGKFMQHF